MSASEPLDSPPGRFQAYLELLRLPNLFTAAADVVMGFLVTHEVIESQEGWLLGLQAAVSALLEQWGLLGLLVAASMLLYAGGVVLNDVFDFSIDKEERPSRPLPSGRVSLSAARRLGWSLLLVGAALGWGAGLLSHDIRPGVVATLLAGCVVLYDGLLKRTPLGPIGMGACRALNVLLGMSVLVGSWDTYHLLIAGGIGVYIVGVTWYARNEAWESSRLQLVLAVVVMLVGIGLLAWLPSWTEPSDQLRGDLSRWYLMMSILGALIGWQCLRAVVDPQPLRVQLAVKQSILSLVILDAVVCFALRGTGAAVVVVLFLVPAVLLGRWSYST